MVLHGWIILLTFALSNRSYMEDRYIIYLHVNKINNKVYVGITKHSNPELRWRHGREYRKNVVFTRALDKYGWDGFDHIVLFRNLPKEIACKLEIKLIARYRKKDICYNVADGGQGTSAMNNIIKTKISKSCIGKNVGDSNPMRNLTEEQRKFHSDKMKRTWETKRELILINQKKGFERARKEGKYDNRHPNFTEEGKKRIYSAVSKAKSVSVLCYSLDWVFIKKYKSISEANMSFNKEASRPDISRACRDSTKSAYGYRWRYEGKEVNNG